MILIFLGGVVWMSIFPVIIRRAYYLSHAKRLLTHGFSCKDCEREWKRNQQRKISHRFRFNNNSNSNQNTLPTDNQSGNRGYEVGFPELVVHTRDTGLPIYVKPNLQKILKSPAALEYQALNKLVVLVPAYLIGFQFVGIFILLIYLSTTG